MTQSNAYGSPTICRQVVGWPMMIAATFASLFTLATCSNVSAGDWPRFRGPSGTGVSHEASVPTRWSAEANLAWKSPLPGPGASSPIIVGGKVFVTSYSGYGLSRDNPGNIEELVRHLTCFDLLTGKQLWQQDVGVTLPEDPYTGIGVTAHGYASHTPVSDGERVYAFFGKSGVHAFDLDGKKLWEAEVGKESDPTKWGSSSSPIVYEGTVIITASAESQAIIGLDATTGKELWRQEAEGLDGMWGTPTLVEIDQDRTDLVMCVARELWGLDPNSGKLRWYANATGATQAHASVIAEGKQVYAVTGRGGGAVALEAGGSGDVSESNTIWEGNTSGSFGTPVRHGSKIYVVSRNVVNVIDAESGERVEQVRLRGAQSSGRGGGSDYASPVVVGDHLFYLNGGGQMFVLEMGDTLKQVSINQVTKERENFWGTPAVSDDRMVLRSGKYLYCVADKGETVSETDNLIAQADDADEEPEANERRGGGRGGRFDPMAMFDGMDTNKDGQVSEQELEGNRMADRLKTLDKDGDMLISKEEFRTGFASLFNRGGGGGGRNRGGGGRGGYGGGEDPRPDRPQRPESANP